MADYYPLIARAVANLPHDTEAARNTVYERARSALGTQLRGWSESDAARERQALEAAIRKIEAADLSAAAGATGTTDRELQQVGNASNGNIEQQGQEQAQIARESTSKSTLYCSFCAKTQDQVQALIAGPKHFICDECVASSARVCTHIAD